jgi:hypothetical protein
MTSKAVEFTTPPGQMVWGSLYEPRDTDFDGNPLIYKKGADAGKSYVMYDFGVAVPKTQAHFANEPGWGQLAWATAHAAFPGGDKSAAMAPEFSWKITDGDSTRIPPKSKSKIAPCDREGHKGCWILKFSSQFAPKIYDARDVDHPVLLEGANAIVPGYVIQVVGTMAGNTGNSPGIYLNHAAVGLRAYLPEIRTAGVDVTGKFGGTLPSGASTVPAAGFAPPAVPAAAPAPSAALPPPPGAAAPPPAAPAPAAAPTAVVPAPGIVGIPPTVGAPPPPSAAPAAPPAPATRPPHKGIAFASYMAQGWTLEQMRADGYAG